MGGHSRAESEQIEAAIALKHQLEDNQLRVIRLCTLNIREIEQIMLKKDDKKSTPFGMADDPNNSYESSCSSSHSDDGSGHDCVKKNNQREKKEYFDQLIQDPSKFISNRDLILKMKNQLTQLKNDAEFYKGQMEKSSKNATKSKKESEES